MTGKFFKSATVIVVLLLLVRPDTIMLALFIDSVGLELFLFLVSLQFKTFAMFLGAYIQSILRVITNKIEFRDSFYFWPSLESIKMQPAIACHAIPCYGYLLNAVWLIRGQPRCF
ncbi:MAG: hypothetical protein ACI9J5_003512 [Paraglaciecola sp.]|jgi:hypothetical protein